MGNYEENKPYHHGISEGYYGHWYDEPENKPHYKNHEHCEHCGNKLGTKGFILKRKWCHWCDRGV